MKKSEVIEKATTQIHLYCDGDDYAIYTNGDLQEMNALLMCLAQDLRDKGISKGFLLDTVAYALYSK